MLKKSASVLALILLAVTVSATASHAETITRWVSGSVVATDTVANPNTIVVKSRTWKGETLTVGASLTGNTTIMSDGRAITLAEVRPGDQVDMVYERNSEVTVKSITVNR